MRPSWMRRERARLRGRAEEALGRLELRADSLRHRAVGGRFADDLRSPERDTPPRRKLENGARNRFAAPTNRRTSVVRAARDVDFSEELAHRGETDVDFLERRLASRDLWSPRVHEQPPSKATISSERLAMHRV